MSVACPSLSLNCHFSFSPCFRDSCYRETTDFPRWFAANTFPSFLFSFFRFSVSIFLRFRFSLSWWSSLRLETKAGKVFKRGREETEKILIISHDLLLNGPIYDYEGELKNRGASTEQKPCCSRMKLAHDHMSGRERSRSWKIRSKILEGTRVFFVRPWRRFIRCVRLCTYMPIGNFLCRCMKSGYWPNHLAFSRPPSTSLPRHFLLSRRISRFPLRSTATGHAHFHRAQYPQFHWLPSLF